MTPQDDIKRIQVILRVVADGIWGTKSQAAMDALLNAVNMPAPPPQSPLARVDERSEGNIATLHPRVQPLARALVVNAAAQGITIKILSGTRTYAEQDALFAKGGVTKARGGFSNHNFGIAFDVGAFNGTRYVPESPIYKAVAVLAKQLGFEWGGDWKSFVDEPHYQLRPPWARGMSERDMLAELRSRRASGKDAFA